MKRGSEGWFALRHLYVTGGACGGDHDATCDDLATGHWVLAARARHDLGAIPGPADPALRGWLLGVFPG